MNPTVPRVLSGIAGSLAANVMPEVRSPFGQQTTGLAAQLAMMIAQEWDRAAARLVDENSAIIGLFDRALPLLPENALRDRLLAATGIVPGSDLRISALQAENDGLRALLIELHAVVEQLEGAEPRVLETLIWDELRESTRRRHLVSGLG